MQLFAEDGYAHTSIDKIAQKAGIARGLLYSYFENKEDLLRKILLSGIEKISEIPFPENTTADEFIYQISIRMDLVIKYKTFFQLYTALSVQPGVAEKIGDITEAYQQAIHGFWTYMQQRFGDNFIKELLLLSTMMKGYAILALFDYNQKVVPLDMLKETVIEFFNERYKNNDKNSDNENI
jgi:AcrR family transcriptional regulator